MAFVLGLYVAEGAPSPRRDAVWSALGVDDDGALACEIGRAETGATCTVVDEGGAMTQRGLTGWRVSLPLIRSPSSARDLLPTMVAALTPLGRLGVVDEGPESADELIARWDQAHGVACRDLAALCAAQGSPLPPFLPAAALARVHGWLVALGARPDVNGPIFGVDFGDGESVTLAVPLPRAGLLPPVGAVLVEGDGGVRVLPLDATAGPDGFVVVDDALVQRTLAAEGRAAGRIVAPVEIVDLESLTGERR